ncbi:hypothetical protein TBLA_0A00560 [Henningerozyma blattae CBS 6284]|uniref:Vacuolar protein sorting-associated protein 28 n=1 Tax=Henningerozyma blattae (strain ATCC 34711 / CBS 6284 / DSM 70876 / NBRC 10599 / NRRL Y-10934 / UCD 77-7) TaxID=1071380 RepID=I2GUQ5_HENB6|nr:hypothetical protein TBLA_0A00560 [Tetrapisispora blattae CBS 6284]CCH57857.1 hypothetical protein TBLA_0A00560 [Tetrapisispora blattae CBS 6284]
MSQYNPKLYEEIPLYDPSTNSRKERETLETLAEIYSIIIAIDQVEKAYLKDSITNDEYTNTLNKLLVQYKTYLSNDNDDVKKEFEDLYQFKNTYNIIAPNAITRIERGMPVTVEHAIMTEETSGKNMAGSKSSKNGKSSGGNGGKNIAEATGNFITIMDALKLNYRAKDQLHPLMADLLLSINKVTRSDFEHRSNLVEWIVKINKMKVNEQLTDDEARELLFDLDLAYKSFYTVLG